MSVLPSPHTMVIKALLSPLLTALIIYYTPSVVDGSLTQPTWLESVGYALVGNVLGVYFYAQDRRY